MQFRTNINIYISSFANRERMTHNAYASFNILFFQIYKVQDTWNLSTNINHSRASYFFF